MPESSENKKNVSNLELELYLLIAKFLRTGPCQQTAEVLRKEIDEHKLLPKRVDWLGNEHNRSFNEVDAILSQVSDDHLYKICARIGPILDKEIPPTVSGLTSLLGVGRQSLLRTREELEKPCYQINNLSARKYGTPLYPSPVTQSTYPPNIAQVLIAREYSGAISSRHVFSPKICARQQPYRRLLGHLSSVYCVLFDRTGKYIFTGADDNLVKIWSALDGRLLATLRGHSAEITDMAVNYENTLLAAGSCDKTIRVWCLHSTAPVAVLNGHTGMVTSLQFCPYPKSKEQLLISTGNDGCICFWQWNPRTNVFNPKPLKFTERNKAGAQMLCSSFSPGGLFLATGSSDHNVRVYNIAGFNGPEKILEREAHTDRVDSLQFSNLDCRFVSGSKDGTALIWKYEKRSWSSIQLKMTTKLPSDVTNESEDTKTKLRVTMVGWTLDDSKVVTAVSDYSIKVWDSYNGKLCHILKGHEDEVFVLEAHPTDSRVFLSSGHDGRIILWDLVSGSIVKNHFNLIEGQGHGAVFDCKFSPDGLMFASTDSHGHLCMFGYGSNEPYKKVPEEQFFHTDYRPLIRDINHHVLDEQTQTAPHLLPPPFLVDIDGNPYPPNLQRLVPGREQCNESQLIPYVAVYAEGESEVLQPVRPANDGLADRPTIDDMIERLQQEQQNQNQNQDRDATENGPSSSSSSSRTGRSSRRLQSASGDDRSAQEPFSPRTPRSQAGHSRVGLRRTGDVEGVQSVGNWQSRVNQGELPAWVKRVFVKPIGSNLAKAYHHRRTCLADHELTFFNKELKKRLPSDPGVDYNDQNRNRRVQRRSLRASARSRNPDENFNNIYGEEFEDPDKMHLNSSTDTEESEKEEKKETTEESSEESGSEYSDWVQEIKHSKTRLAASSSKPSTSTKHFSRRSKRRTHYNTDSSDDEPSEGENSGEDEEEESFQEDSESPKKVKKRKIISKKKTVLNGKKVPDRFRPPEWLTDVMPHKAPYVPQVGDEVVYFRQGHELYVQAVKRNQIYDIKMRRQPWHKLNLRDQEVARIEDITFENMPPRLCCLKLVLLNPASKQADTFTVKYHDMPDVIDFIVLRQNYDQAMCYEWKSGDRFRSAIDKRWWLGTIKSQKPLNPNFPDSMFQCFVVLWDNSEMEQMSPWDFEPIDNERLPDDEGGAVDITPEERQAMMYIPETREWSQFGRDHDCDRIARGLSRIMELSIAEPFVLPVDLDTYPTYAIVVEYPMDLGTIKARVQNRYYRRVDAVKFDVRYIYNNAIQFNEPGSRIVKQAKCVVDLCIRFFESHKCADPMIIYHEMMEAKQSRSQDSQSELDVLCSEESDSDGELNTTKKMKRKKQSEMQHSRKRVKLGSQRYTSATWRQQCSALLDSIFQWEDSTPFRYPVNLNEYPDYRDIVDCPMDLSTVREKLSNNHYSSPTDVCKDMRLIFQNSRNYNTNKKSRIYSMTIRLSAMFEEHIRGIVSDWRSAVKYEEKIRNNQYVSNRRRPIPVQEGGINVGASTSHGFTASLPSTSRGESSKHSVNKILNAAYHDHPRSSQSSKMANGAGSSLTNGIVKKQVTRISKRKTHEKSPKKYTQTISKREPSNTGVTQSESDRSNPLSSPESNSSGDTEWGKYPKSIRRKTNSQTKKRLRARTLPNHKKHPRSPLLTRHAKRLRLRSLSSSPDNRVVNMRRRIRYSEKNALSPLHTRSQQHVREKAPIIHTLRSAAQKFHSSGDSSEFDESATNNKINIRGYNSSSSSSVPVKNQKKRRTVKIRETLSNETEDSSEQEHRAHKLPKITHALTTTSKQTSPQKLYGRIKTRNSGQRTVSYDELDDDAEAFTMSDNENTEPGFSSSNRGQLRPKRVLKSERPAVLKASAYLRRKHMNSSLGSSLTNGISKRQATRITKRKLLERTPKKHTQNISKSEPSNTEGSRSESDHTDPVSSPESNSSGGDTEWGTKAKRIRRDLNSQPKKRLRPRTPAKHNEHSRSPLMSRYGRRLGLRSRSSSPENQVVRRRIHSPEKNALSPLLTRSQRQVRDRGPIIHTLRSTTQKPQNSSGESSESDESAVNNRRSARIVNSSSSSNISSLRNQKNQRTAKNRESLSNETEDSSEHEEEKSGKSARTTAKLKPKMTRALTTTSRRVSPQKLHGRIKTRNCGQRTVRYDESEDDAEGFRNSDSENTEPILSVSSRGRLRKLTNHARAFFHD